MPLELPPLSSTAADHDWRYTAEGGANLVLSFSGTHTSPFAHHVLRLRKRKLTPTTRRADDAVPSDVDVDFGASVVAPLLGPTSVVDMRKVELERPWLDELVRALREEDLVAGDGVLAVEIKPKWGFLPARSCLSPDTADIKSHYCRTCMHCYHKSRKSGDHAGSGDDDDGFCPLDLYSGDVHRTTSAVTQLYRSWKASNGSLNNLRVFYEGKRVSPDQFLDSHSLHDVLARHASSIDGALSPDVDLDPAASTFCTSLAHALVASPLLRTLAHFQSSLDALDIEGLAALLLAHPATRADLVAPADKAAAEVTKLGAQPALAEWEAFIARLGPALSQGRDAAAVALREGPPRDAVLAYLLSATLKDCSLIVRVPPRDGSGAVTVKAIDLDPKPIVRMGKYARLDGEIVQSWSERIERLAEGDELRRCKV
ncbi:uncharacterized protein RHOBADRAFT_53078 [Rhodotorula graminis WP1]|uniref:Inositol-pentakisphosphate 2-kinase n=1 Tax=Rhodotorula graminis (strain WP1) TaxID=578459 RepID=A0A194S672_RHOGW|nr:uncharacterized protein RHOBADRAFT_53078 [Rhodotorula graminis WP1]KPV76087.1 hypothetical protein RHOBADRAFT_53078 [Rhodotorula graminis WP1]